jgi:hypothetical protein
MHCRLMVARVTDIAALLVPGRVLTADDVAALQAALGTPAWQMRQSRLDARDAAVREALEALAPLGASNAAKALARAWAATLRGAAINPAIAPLVACAATLHGDTAPLSWTQIARIGRTGRTPEPRA